MVDGGEVEHHQRGVESQAWAGWPANYLIRTSAAVSAAAISAGAYDLWMTTGTRLGPTELKRRYQAGEIGMEALSIGLKHAGWMNQRIAEYLRLNRRPGS